MASNASEGEEKCKGCVIFNMESLSIGLPQKRGLSEYFCGKSKSFKCISDAHSIDDLKKQRIPEAKRRKYMNRRDQELSSSSP